MKRIVWTRTDNCKREYRLVAALHKFTYSLLTTPRPRKEGE